jgi:hypothetical protein
VVETTERYADGLEPVATLDDACERGFSLITGAYSMFDFAAVSAGISAAVHASLAAMRRMEIATEYDRPLLIRVVRRKHIRSHIARNHTDLLRCIFGNPFRPVAFDSAWQSETAVALAAGIYADRAFDRLPILADTLEEAGCDDADVLNHCRGPGPHARGCWVVDGVLGKGTTGCSPEGTTGNSQG